LNREEGSTCKSFAVLSTGIEALSAYKDPEDTGWTISSVGRKTLEFLLTVGNCLDGDGDDDLDRDTDLHLDLAID